MICMKSKRVTIQIVGKVVEAVGLLIIQGEEDKEEAKFNMVR